MTQDLPWSERIRLDQIGPGLHRDLTADEATRKRIAEALDLESLDRMEASLDLRPGGEGWRLTGTVSASVVQACGVTLEPLPSEVNTKVSVDLIAAPSLPPSAEPEEEIENPDGPDVVEDGGVDIAVYAVEHLFLALDPYPRKPGAVFEAPVGEAEPSPFDVLKSLKPKA